jgi:hypothetical protein
MSEHANFKSGSLKRTGILSFLKRYDLYPHKTPLDFKLIHSTLYPIIPPISIPSSGPPH